MGGDLNLKKSWHPSLMTNQKRVWEEEKRALDERKKIDQIRKERDEERQMEELQTLQEAAGGKKRQARVDWMYAGPAAGQTGTSEENEAYLLGKRRVDTLLQGKEKENLQKSAGQESFMEVQNASSAKDTASKIRDDPLLAIKKQEQAAYEAMMNDPIKRRMLLKAAGQDDPTEREREHKRRKHHHRSHRDRDYDRDDRHRSSRRHRDSRDDRRDRPREHRRRPSSVSESRSPSPYARERRSASPDRQRRLFSPINIRERSRSPYRRSRGDNGVRRTKSWHDSRRRSASRSPSRSPPTRNRSPEERKDDTAARLAAMQQDASELDQQRQRRLQDIEARDRAASERDDAARARASKYNGGRAGFVDGLHKRAGDMSLSERVGRNHAGARFERDDD